MASKNLVVLIGNVVRDIELKYMPNQTAVCDVGLAINRSWTGTDGVKKEETTFVDCSCFGKAAETLSKYVKKGDPLYVDGRLKLDQWDAQDGTKRSKLRVIIENFQFLNRAPANPGGGEYDGETTQPAAQASPAQRQAAQPARQAYRKGSPADASMRRSAAEQILDAEPAVEDLPF